MDFKSTIPMQFLHAAVGIHSKQQEKKLQITAGVVAEYYKD